MKSTYASLLILCLVTTMVACKKDKGEDAPAGIKGTWELAAYESSWFAPATYPPGNGVLVKFKDDDTYVNIKDGLVTEQGNYATEADTSKSTTEICLANAGKFINRIDFSNITPARTVLFKSFFYIEDDMLYINSGCRANDSYLKATYRRVVNNNTF